MSTPNINQILHFSPRSCTYGAPMGARSFVDDVADENDQKMYVQRIQFVDGDYARDGTYWGNGGGPLYCGFTPSGSARVYVRAKNRKDAIAQIREEYPELPFKIKS